MPRFLILQLARFGDLIQTGRLARSLAALGETHLCVDCSLVPLARLVYPELTVHGLVAHGGATTPDAEGALFTHNRALFDTLGQMSFSRIYNLNHSPLNLALSTLFDPDLVRGYRLVNGQPLRERWVHLAFRWTTMRRHAPLNLMDFWAHLCKEGAPRASLPLLAPSDVHPVARPGGRGLGVALAGRHARRSLPPEILAPCVHALFERMGGPEVFLFGSAAERPLGRRLQGLLPASMQDKTRNLAGRTDWEALHEAVTGLDLLLTPDTGLMHLAASLGVPVQAIFLSSAWAWETGPYGAGHRVWQAAPGCAPCAETASCPFAQCGQHAPANAASPCLRPFQERGFLRALATGDTKALPPELQALDADFDTLGLVWKGEDDPVRDAARQTLAAYLGLSLPRTGQPALESELAETLYLEADWMLPDIIA